MEKPLASSLPIVKAVSPWRLRPLQSAPSFAEVHLAKRDNLVTPVPLESEEHLAVMAHPVSLDPQDLQELSVRTPIPLSNNTMLKHMEIRLVVTISLTDPTTSRPKWELLELVDPPDPKDPLDLKVQEVSTVNLESLDPQDKLVFVDPPDQLE